MELAHNLPVKTRANDLQSRFSQLFAEIAALRPYELLRQDAERAKFYVKSSARVLLITLADVAQHVSFAKFGVLTFQSFKVCRTWRFTPTTLY